jgi:putative membrane protein
MACDPRVYFAAERTLLAWVRTGITMMGFGFVVARFGFFLELLAAEHVQVKQVLETSPGLSNAIGIGLVLAGSLAMIVPALQFKGFVASLPPGDLPPSHSRAFPVGVAMALGVLGLGLAVYLMI